VLLSFLVTANEPDAGQTLNYSLLDPPTNATLNANSGLFSWTPSEAQGPSTIQINVRVTDNGSPALSATNSFVIVVNEVNLAPALAAIPNLTAIRDVLLLYTNSATDADLPANSLTFDLVTFPPGMTVDAASGLLRWTPSAGQVPSTNTVTVRVTDNGLPPKSDSQSFTVTAQPLPFLTISRAGTNVVVSWPAYAAGFALQCSTNLHPFLWWNLTNAVTTEAGTNRVTDRLEGPRRYYRLRYPPGSSLPALTILKAGTNVTVSWPASATGFVLEWTPNLGPAAAWSSATNPVVIQSDRKWMTNAMDASRRYYRLRYP
jgi:hypothetical protein